MRDCDGVVTRLAGGLENVEDGVDAVDCWGRLEWVSKKKRRRKEEEEEGRKKGKKNTFKKKKSPSWNNSCSLRILHMTLHRVRLS